MLSLAKGHVYLYLNAKKSEVMNCLLELLSHSFISFRGPANILSETSIMKFFFFVLLIPYAFFRPSVLLDIW
jgi:hypothetical protein